MKPTPVPTPKRMIPKQKIRTLPQLRSAIQSSESGPIDYKQAYIQSRTGRNINDFANKKANFKPPLVTRDKEQSPYSSKRGIRKGQLGQYLKDHPNVKVRYKST